VRFDRPLVDLEPTVRRLPNRVPLRRVANYQHRFSLFLIWRFAGGSTALRQRKQLVDSDGERLFLVASGTTTDRFFPSLPEALPSGS
jgi:hypothetical protein